MTNWKHYNIILSYKEVISKRAGKRTRERDVLVWNKKNLKNESQRISSTDVKEC